MLDVELAASTLNLYSSHKIKLITITGGGGEMFQELSKEQ